jgi:hypothetical protein
MLTFDDNYFPNVNTLYINLFAGQYYNDNIYNKKKVEKEREDELVEINKKCEAELEKIKKHKRFWLF